MSDATLYDDARTDEEVLRVCLDDIRQTANVGGIILLHPKTSIIVDLLAAKKDVSGDYFVTGIRLLNDEDIAQFIREHAGKLL